jgi:hypothetical protein|tara:strand:- start:162 stop:1211 length:1050 start_codon:yes stop_codon:yes gene_type:complete
MAYASISKSSLHFNTKLYTGTGSSNAITGVGFQPDFVWLKRRDSTGSHRVFDAVRGATKEIFTDATNVESTTAESLKSFDSDGFTMGTDAGSNGSSRTFVSWNLKAGGAGSSNTDGSITATVSANTTAGFSIVKYTGNNTAGATVGHGLGAVPKFIIMKELGGTNGWHVYHHSIGNDNVAVLDQTAGYYTSNNFLNSTNPTSSIFTLGQNGGSNATTGMIAYCFAEKKGFSKFGSYVGNNSTDGTFCYTGFKPAFVLHKRVTPSGTSTDDSWVLSDATRNTTNPIGSYLFADQTNAESSTTFVDYYSNGFKFRIADNTTNNNGDTYIFASFAEEPLVANVGQSIPATAR